MHKKILSAFIAVVMLLSAFSLSSCSGESEYPVNIGKITIKSEPENIVILTKNLADVISQIGYDVKMVGRSDDVTQEGMQVVPSMGTAQSPIPASIDEAEADVVFADNTLDTAVKEELEEKGIPVVILEEANTPKQVKAMYKKLGKILGGNITGTKQGKDAFDDLTGTLKDVKAAAVADASVVRTIAYLYIDNGVLKTFNSSKWGSNILSYTGAVNVFKNADSDIVNNSELALSNPDFIFCADENTENYINSTDSLAKLSALSENTFILPYSDITMQGTTTLNVVEDMLRNMYPEEFSD